MKRLALAGLALLLGLGAAQAGDEPKKEQDKNSRAAAALRDLEKALADLPAAVNADALKKAADQLRKELTADVQQQLKSAEAGLEQFKDRVAWAQRMLQKGYLSQQQLQADRTRLKDAVAALDNLRRVVQLLGGEARKAREPAARAAWEYRVLSAAEVGELGKNDLAAGLNQLGGEGWELVSVEPRSRDFGVQSARYYFKRAKSASP
jgi:hypothetical protein